MTNPSLLGGVNFLDSVEILQGAPSCVVAHQAIVHDPELYCCNTMDLIVLPKGIYRFHTTCATRVEEHPTVKD